VGKLSGNIQVLINISYIKKHRTRKPCGRNMRMTNSFAKEKNDELPAASNGYQNSDFRILKEYMRSKLLGIDHKKIKENIS